MPGDRQGSQDLPGIAQVAFDESLAKLVIMTLVRWWFSADELQDVHHLGWFGGPGQVNRLRPAWFTDSGLDPDKLIRSELFQSNNIEKVVDTLAIPAADCGDAAQMSIYLQERGWEWLPHPPSPTESTAVVARTATNVHFWIGSTGLLVEFERSSPVDSATGKWIARWPGFLLASLPTLGTYGKAAGYSHCIEVLEYIEGHMPWLAVEAHSAYVEANHLHAKAVQDLFKKHRGDVIVILPAGARDAAEGMQTPPDRGSELIGADEEDPRQEDRGSDG